MKVELTTSPDEADVQFIRQGLQDYEAGVVPGVAGLEEDVDFAIFARDDNDNIIAGLRAHAFWNAMHIQLLWVADEHRAKNLGSRLLQQAEEYAVENEFGVAYLDTSQARSFYEKHGYTVFGTIEDQPAGHDLYFMKKRLI